MSANEKPSERAAMMLAANMFLAGIGPYIDPVSVEGAAKIIAIHTSCDSLAEENQRLKKEFAAAASLLDRAGIHMAVFYKANPEGRAILSEISKFCETEIAVEALKK